MGSLESPCWCASNGGGGRACGGRYRRRRARERRPEFGCGRVRRCCSQTRELRRWRGSTGHWGHQEHSEATSAGGGAREHEAHRPWRTATSGARGAAATGHAREKEVRAKEEGLTADSQSSSMGSGKLLRRRIDGGDLRWPTRGTAVLATFRGFRRRTAR